MHDAIVIGGGLFGSVAADALRINGLNVLMIDDRRPHSGSAAAACLMKPSWLTKLGKPVVESSLALLDGLYGVQTLQFSVPPTRGFVSVDWVDPRQVLDGREVVNATVQKIEGTTVITNKGEYEGRLVVVAAGIWTPLLVEQLTVAAKTGVAVRYLHGPQHKNVIKPWAPYKQMVKFSEAGFSWAGDGTAIKGGNWTEERKKKSIDRIIEFAPMEGFAQTIVGNRPYMKLGTPAFAGWVEPGVFAITGGAKNGTVAAAWSANQLLEKAFA